MSTDLDQLSKELELVKARELDPFAKPIEPEADVKPKASSDVFGMRCLVSDEQMDRYRGNPETLVIDSFIRMINEVSAVMGKAGYLVRPETIVFDRMSKPEFCAQDLGLQVRGQKSKLLMTNQLINTNQSALLEALKKVVHQR